MAELSSLAGYYSQIHSLFTFWHTVGSSNFVVQGKLTMTRSLQWFWCVCLAWSALLQGCTSVLAPSAPRADAVIIPSMGSPEIPWPVRKRGNQPSIGSEIVIRAISLLGTPYKFGGNGPKAFDCSGLVKFIHSEVGIQVPRTAAEQYRAAIAVQLTELKPGDVLFFKIKSKSISHVGIYAGSGRFFHAPQTGRSIELRTLDDDYYKSRLIAAGRLF